MSRLLSAVLGVSLSLSAIPASAQTGDGSLRGYVKDQQGGVLPGVTVTAKSPDLLSPVTAATDTSRRLFSDVLDMAPGVSSRNVDDGVGRRAYYFHGAVIFSHVFQIEGAPASSFLDSSAHSMGMGGDAIADSELKLGGVDASAPMGTGVVMNVMTPQGGNRFKVGATYDYQAREWNSDNTDWGQFPGGLPTIQSVKQFDASLGGPVVKDRIWFFGSYRNADL